MLGADVHPKIISKLLGHASISTTMDIYSHILPGVEQDAAKAFDLANNLLTNAATSPDTGWYCSFIGG